MSRLVLVLFFVLPFLPGKSLGAPPVQVIEAHEGRNVPLLCDVQPPINLKNYSWDLKRTDGNFSQYFVYSRRHGKEYLDGQMKQYSGRVLVNDEDLINNVFNVTIVSVELPDSGTYKVYIPQLKKAFYFKLVVKKDDLKGTQREDLTSMKPLVVVTGNPDVATNELRHRWYIFIPVGVFLIFTGVLTCCCYKNHRRQEQTQENGTGLLGGVVG